MSVIIVSGALANKPFQGGEAWVRLSWALGFQQLGHEVYFIEQIAPEACVDSAGRQCLLAQSINRSYFDAVKKQFGLTAALICEQTEAPHGLPASALLKIAESADLLVNIGGHLKWRTMLDRIPRTAFVDIDPGFTQFWHLDPMSGFKIAKHDWYFTIGENINSPGCSLPTADIAWLPIRQPVVLEHWSVASASSRKFTTIANWRGPFGPIAVAGSTYGQKVHEFRKFLELPRRSDGCFELALNIHPDERRDIDALQKNGWQLTDPNIAADTPDAFRTYIQQSGAEFSAAQGIYVDTNSGWFSDRTARYLASGKPALVQDTGFGSNLPVGEGLLSFRTLEDAQVGVEKIMTNYEVHAQAARRIAEQYFDAKAVLKQMLREIGLESGDSASDLRDDLANLTAAAN